MDKVILLLGSNQGDRMELLLAAKDSINRDIGKVVQLSSVYETAAWGREDLPAHLNQVLVVETTFTPEAILEIIHRIENALGRERHERWGIRSIDIDILYYNESVYKSDSLIIPHPRIQDRRFTLVPLCEILPQMIHPVFQCTNMELLDSCADTLPVSLFE